MKTLETRQKSDPFLLACAAIPAAGLAAFYSFVVRAWLELGAWPKPNLPDPKDLGFEVHYISSFLFLIAALLSPLALALCLFVRQAVPMRGRSAGKALVLFFSSYVALCGLFIGDPGALFAWFAD